MREGILFLLIFLWLLSGDDAPRTDYLQKILHQLHDEADMCANKTFRTNMTYVRRRQLHQGDVVEVCH